MIKRQQAADASAETLAGVAGTRHNLVRNCNTRDSTAACVEAVVTQKYSAQSRPSVLFFFIFYVYLIFPSSSLRDRESFLQPSRRSVLETRRCESLRLRWSGSEWGGGVGGQAVGP